VRALAVRVVSFRMQVRQMILTERQIQIGFVLFPNLTQLDLTGPLEVLARVPGAVVHLVSESMEPIRSDVGLTLVPSTTFATCPQLDVVCVPGGPGVNDAMMDDSLLEYLRTQASHADWVTSVCSGALVLGAAGLLDGYRATTHWASMDLLPAFGAIPVARRVCFDRNRITGGGVTAGIDFGLEIAAQIAGKATAQRIQLYLEYAPEPPFASGSPESAPPAVLGAYRELAAPMMGRRQATVADAVSRLATTRSQT
jgi:cyclohexyl-isocyanide hydratase